MTMWEDLNESRAEVIRKGRAEDEARLRQVKVTYVEVGNREGVHLLTRLCCGESTAKLIEEWCAGKRIPFYSVATDGITAEAVRCVRDDAEDSRKNIVFGCVLEGDNFRGWGMEYDPLRRGA